MKAQIRIYGTIEKETAKAVLAKLTWEHPSTMNRKQWNAWLPKSQVDIKDNSEDLAFLGEKVLLVNKWLADKIGNEIRAFIGAPPTGASIFYEA